MLIAESPSPGECAVHNIPSEIADRYHGDLSPGIRPLYVEEFQDGTGFVFNLDRPSGVTYLEKHAFDVYRKLSQTNGQLPTVDQYNGPLYADFIKLGIARSCYAQRQLNSSHSHPRQFGVWFHIVNACNLSCRYCYIPNLQRMADAREIDDNVMSQATIERATLSLFEFCKTNGFASVLIKFAGGEPALCADQITITCQLAERYAEQYGIAVKFAMLSNGVLLDDQLCELLVRHNISVSISVDGDMDAHNDVRFTILNTDGCRNHVKAGTWDSIDGNVRNLIAHGIRPYFMCTVTEKNYHKLSGLFRYSMGNRIGVRLSMVRDKLTHLRPGLQERIRDELANLYAWLGENMPTDMPIDRFAGFGDWNPSVKKEAICSACRTYAAIDHHGKVASCQMRLSNSKESILEDSFSNVFSRVQKEAENLYLIMPSKKTGSCSACYWKHVCAGGCPEHTRLVVGSTNSPSPWCELFQGLLPHFLRAIAIQMKRRSQATSKEVNDLSFAVALPKRCTGTTERMTSEGLMP